MAKHMLGRNKIIKMSINVSPTHRLSPHTTCEFRYTCVLFFFSSLHLSRIFTVHAYFINNRSTEWMVFIESTIVLNELMPLKGNVPFYSAAWCTFNVAFIFGIIMIFFLGLMKIYSISYRTTVRFNCAWMSAQEKNKFFMKRIKCWCVMLYIK